MRTGLADGEPDGERRSAAFALALGAHPSTVQLDQMAHDRKAQPEAAMGSRRRAVALTKALEDVRQKILTDTFAIVTDAQLGLHPFALQVDLDLAALGRELDRVGEQVPDNLLQARGISRRVGRRR